MSDKEKIKSLKASLKQIKANYELLNSQKRIYDNTGTYEIIVNALNLPN